MAQADRTRTYSDGDWAVRRWDRFNGGSQRRPKSFCQFWRAVLIWATLASIPLIGKMFQSHLYEPPPPTPLDPRILAVGRAVGGGATLAGRGVWTLAWPLRAVLGAAWNGASSAVAWVDERDDVQRRAGYVFNGLVILVLLGATGMMLALISMWFTMAWQADWRLFVIGCESLALFVGALVWGRYQIVAGLLAAGDAILGVLSLLWEIAVVSHHRICPPMEIERGTV